MLQIPITDLPRYWQRHIRELRKENARLRIRSRDLTQQLEGRLEARQDSLAAAK